MIKPAAIARALVVGFLLSAAVRPALANDDSDTERLREVRLAFFKQKLDELRLSPEARPETPFTYTAEPVLRFTNPVRGEFSHGTLFLWLDGKRPVAAVTLSTRRGNKFVREVTSMSTEPLRCERDGTVVWKPASAGLMQQSFDESPQPAQAAPLRLAQMRRLAQRFRGRFTNPTSKQEDDMRLLVQPLYRYADEDSGVLDGAVFALTEANDPEVLVQIEAVRLKDRNEPEWRYSLVRTTSIPFRVWLGDAEVWNVEGYWKSPRTPDLPYMEVFEGTFDPGEAGESSER